MDQQRKVWIYDPNTDSFKPGPEMLVVISAAAVAAKQQQQQQRSCCKLSPRQVVGDYCFE